MNKNTFRLLVCSLACLPLAAAACGINPPEITMPRPARPQRIFMPLMMEDSWFYFRDAWEIEPNNSAAQPNGPLVPGHDIFSYPDDAKDFFSFYLPERKQITVRLENMTLSGVQMQLFYGDAAVNHRVASSISAPYVIEYTAPAGYYLIYVFNPGSFTTERAYTLRVETR